MPTPKLSDHESRVIGCLMEKSVTTPDQYPLTLNALTNACNQKSARAPVMSMSQGEVQHGVRELEAKHLLLIEDNFKRGIQKYTHRFCNTSFSELQFDSGQFAIVCLLLLRGPQTPGEIRARSGRLHEFNDNQAVVEALSGLIEREGDPLVVKLPRSPGRKDSQYMHLFSGEIDLEAHRQQAKTSCAKASPARTSFSELSDRVDELEKQVAKLIKQLGS